MRFITDGMLGKLTRWLRMLGHNVTYFQSIADKQLIETAKKENRVLLTRDLRLFQQAMKQEVDTFLIKATTEVDRLAHLAKQFNFSLEIDVTISRCPKCNTKIAQIPKSNVMNIIPKSTSVFYNQFWKCNGCGQVYWQGSHWKKIEKTLQDAQNTLRIQ